MLRFKYHCLFFQVSCDSIFTSRFSSRGTCQSQNHSRDKILCWKTLASSLISSMVLNVFKKNHFKILERSTCQLHGFLWVFGRTTVAQRSKIFIIDFIYTVQAIIWEINMTPLSSHKAFGVQPLLILCYGIIFSKLYLNQLKAWYVWYLIFSEIKCNSKHPYVG